ncbi:MAG TPA: MAPEG family protein [Rhizomicrobium sp.]|nr:MAPEG family protein [Rhizomicrobium sp.]
MSLLLESSYYAFGFYTALNALIMLILGMLVTRARVRTQTDIGDGGKPEMAGPLRAHANNAEYVPTAILLMWALTMPIFGASIWVIHGIGASLTIGRILHAIGLSRSVGPSALRFIGMILTWIAYVIGIVALFWLVFTSGTAPS